MKRETGGGGTRVFVGSTTSSTEGSLDGSLGGRADGAERTLATVGRSEEGVREKLLLGTTWATRDGGVATCRV